MINAFKKDKYIIFIDDKRKYGVISENELIIEPIFNEILYINDYIAIVRKDDNFLDIYDYKNRIFLLSKNNIIVENQNFNNSFIIIKRKNNLFDINKNKYSVINIIYLENYDLFGEKVAVIDNNHALIKRNNNAYLIDENRNIYDLEDKIDNFYNIRIKDNLMIIKNNTYNIFDMIKINNSNMLKSYNRLKLNRLLADYEIFNIKDFEKSSKIILDAKKKDDILLENLIIDKTGNIKFDSKKYNINKEINGLYIINSVSNNLFYGVLNKNYELLIEPKYKNIRVIDDTLIICTNDNYIDFYNIEGILLHPFRNYYKVNYNESNGILIGYYIDQSNNKKCVYLRNDLKELTIPYDYLSLNNDYYVIGYQEKITYDGNIPFKYKKFDIIDIFNKVIINLPNNIINNYLVNVEEIDQDVLLGKHYFGNKYVLFNEESEIIREFNAIDVQHKYDLIKYKNIILGKELYGLMDYEGKDILSLRYDNIEILDDENVLITIKDNNDEHKILINVYKDLYFEDSFNNNYLLYEIIDDLYVNSKAKFYKEYTLNNKKSNV